MGWVHTSAFVPNAEGFKEIDKGNIMRQVRKRLRAELSKGLFSY